MHGVGEVARRIHRDIVNIVAGLRIQAADGEVEVRHLAGRGAAALKGVHAVAHLQFRIFAVERDAAARGNGRAANEARVVGAVVGVLLGDKVRGDGNRFIGHPEGCGALYHLGIAVRADHADGHAALFDRPAVEYVAGGGFGHDGDQVARAVGAAARTAGDGDGVRAGVNIGVAGGLGVHFALGDGNPVDGAVLVERAGQRDRARGLVGDVRQGDELGRGHVHGTELDLAHRRAKAALTVGQPQVQVVVGQLLEQAIDAARAARDGGAGKPFGERGVFLHLEDAVCDIALQRIAQEAVRGRRDAPARVNRVVHLAVLVGHC